jgi:hypothetical protein
MFQFTNHISYLMSAERLYDPLTTINPSPNCETVAYEDGSTLREQGYKRASLSGVFNTVILLKSSVFGNYSSPY